MTEIIVVGDCHGDINQFIYPLLVFFHDPARYKYLIYLGDYEDRGHSSVNIYIVMRWVMSLNDPRIIFLRGNHDNNYDAESDFTMGITGGPFGAQVSFTAVAFANLAELKNCWYDPTSNIMFTHAGFKNTDLTPQELLETNNAEGYDASGDNELREVSKGSTYKLIHGHDHGDPSRGNVVPSKFFSNPSDTTLNSDLSLDYDCSYGFGYIMRAVYGDRYDSNAYPIGSRVIFCIFDSTNITHYRFPRIYIPYDDPQDLNTKSLQAIEEFLLATIPYSITGGALNLQARFMNELVDYLYAALSKTTNKKVTASSPHPMEDLAPRNCGQFGVAFLYDDVTFELLQQAGFLGNNVPFDPPGVAVLSRSRSNAYLVSTHATPFKSAESAQRFINDTLYHNIGGAHNPNNNYDVVPPSSVLAYLIGFTQNENITRKITAEQIATTSTIPTVTTHPAPATRSALPQSPPQQPIPQNPFTSSSTASMPLTSSNPFIRPPKPTPESAATREEIRRNPASFFSSKRYKQHMEAMKNEPGYELIRGNPASFFSSRRHKRRLAEQAEEFEGGLIKGGCGPSPFVFILKILAIIVCCIAVIALISVVLKTFTGKSLEFAGVKFV